MGNTLDGIHQLYIENYVRGQILHLYRKGFTSRAIAKELDVSVGWTEQIIRERFGRKNEITGYRILPHWKGEAIE